MQRKKRVLFNTEATFVASGFGNYGRELMQRLYNTGKYELAEFASYARHNDNRISNIPWKVYANMPDSPEQNPEYNSKLNNQWGKWRFEEVCLDFQPDVVCAFRDWWCDEYMTYSPFRNFFSLILSPTVDSAPQQELWLSTYMNADAILTYSEFGRDVLLEQTKNRIKFYDVATPLPDDVFKPVEDKDLHKEAMGFEKGTKIVGFVSRNQKRKLIPDLIDGFKTFLEKYTSVGKDTFLYLHTSYPDSGYDIGKLARESGIGHKILFTYLCRDCGHVFPSFFHDAKQTCPKCGGGMATLPNVDKGISRKELSMIINCFDVFVQYANCEGLGMVQLEAAACAVPVMSVDYSAMSSVMENIAGTPIKVQRMFYEAESQAYRALPDNEDLAYKLGKFFSSSKNSQIEKGKKTYIKFKQHYDWGKVVKSWMKAIDDMPQKNPEDTWESPINVRKLDMRIPDGLNDADFVRWCIANILGEPENVNSYISIRMIKDLQWGERIENHGGIYYNEDSLISQQPKFGKFNRSSVVDETIKLAEEKNYWEQRRGGLIQEERPLYIKKANGEI